MKKEIKRPDAPYIMPEGDVETLRKMYEADEWKQLKNCRKLLETAYKEYKQTNRNAKKYDLPDTFKELLDKGEDAFPAKVYIGILGRANIIIDDTEKARDVIERIDKGDYYTKKKKKIKAKEAISELFLDLGLDYGFEDSPKVLTDISFKKNDDGSKTIGQRLAETRIDAEFFLDPGGSLEDSIADAKTDQEKKDAIALYKALTEIGFKEIAEQVAEETGADVADVMNPKKRTAEQYDALLDKIRAKITEKIEIVYKSNFIHALREINRNYTSESKLSSATQREATKYAALYFFATHTEINLREQSTLTDQHKEEVIAIYDKLLAFMEQQLKESHKKKEFMSAWAAFMAFVEAENPQQQEEIEESINVVAREVADVEFPLDKVNSSIWTDLELSKPSGQLSMDFNFEEHMDDLFEIDVTSKPDKAEGKEAIVLYGLSFDMDNLPEGVKITKQITPYDRRCHDAIGALRRAGNSVVSITQIYRAMGRTGKPSTTETKKINNSLTKMRAAMLYIDSSKEAALYKNKPTFHYDGSLLPFERVRATINGREVATAVKILADLPLIRFARGRGQLTTLDLSIRKTPLSLTDSHIRIEDYMTEQISHMKKKKTFPRKITLEKMFTKCIITSKKQRHDAKEAIKELLKYWKEIGFIGEKSSLETDCIIIDV